MSSRLPFRSSVFPYLALPVLALMSVAPACVPADDPDDSGSGGRSGAGGVPGTGGARSGTVACGGSSGTSALATWANLREVVDNTCFGSDCHTQGDREPMLLGINGTAISDVALYDKLTTYKTTKCGKRALVKPCAPDESAFYLAQSGQCGDLAQMPFGCEPQFENCTSPDKLEGIRQWIANGARSP